MTWDSKDEGKYKAYMNILIWSCFWTLIFLYLFFFFFQQEGTKKDAPAKPSQGMKGGYLRSGPNRGGNKAIFPSKIKTSRVQNSGVH
ncbi:hypothetical protein AB205_0161430 [Aquarana catesbeiana]|uniref:Uncharacterized protein n=1 Tax=Aquarana catesbeiana TaxID=8400 RepID=A0A2G9RPE3_AQUCT|nr:hypothetical protein AB205_0161430 [Aquarana catesbeiana]